jgi:hypothetical protein
MPLTNDNIATTGRSDLDNFFKSSGIFGSTKLSHTPFLVFVPNGEKIEVVIEQYAKDLLNYPDGTKVMAQWPGQWRSDFFHFTIGDYRRHLGTSVTQ